MWAASFQGKLLLFKEYNNVKGVTGTIVFFEKGNGILLKATPNIFKEIVPITETARRKRVDLSRGILYTRAGTA